MDFDGSIYPSRMFIRCTAHNQLLTDLTEQAISTFVQLEGEAYLHAIAPTEYFDVKPLDLEDLDINFNVPMAWDDFSLEFDAIELLEDPSEDDWEWETMPLTPLGSADSISLDEALLEDIATTIFSSNRYPELYRAYATKEAAAEIEFYVAQEIVTTYKRILSKRHCPTVQALNQLLDL
ncbi:MAG TPA: hypothetical protein V6C78_33480 [Crinalium sp.]|jgi:hypothetical protein